MSFKVEEISSLERKISFEIPAEEVKKEYQYVYKEVQKNAKIKGFRVGKVPMNLVKTNFKNQIDSHVIQHLVEDNFYKALEEKGLNPINQPQLHIHELDENKPFTFSLTFEVHPKVEVKKYQGLKVQKEKIIFDDSHVHKTLDNIRSSHAETIAVLEDRPAQMGDIAVIDFEGFVDGAPLENGSGQNHPLELGSKSFIEGFEDAIVGMKVGTTITAKHKFPDEYHEKDIAGKPVEFKITLKELKKKVLPEVNDEFAKSIGFESVQKLKEAVELDYIMTEERRVQEDLKNRLLRKLAEENPFDVPKTLLQRQKEFLILDTLQRMANMGLSQDQLQEYTNKWDQDFTQTAKFIIQCSYLVNKIADLEKLYAEESDIEQRIQSYISQTGIEEEKIRSIYSQPENRNKLKNIITEEKVIEYLISKSQIEEVVEEEL
jgi:trigger factor